MKRVTPLATISADLTFMTFKRLPFTHMTSDLMWGMADIYLHVACEHGRVVEQSDEALSGAWTLVRFWFGFPALPPSLCPLGFGELVLDLSARYDILKGLSIG